MTALRYAVLTLQVSNTYILTSRASANSASKFTKCAGQLAPRPHLGEKSSMKSKQMHLRRMCTQFHTRMPSGRRRILLIQFGRKIVKAHCKRGKGGGSRTCFNLGGSKPYCGSNAQTVLVAGA